MTWLADGFQSENTESLKRLYAAIGHNSGSGFLGVGRPPIDFRLGVRVPDRQDDGVPLIIVDDGLRRVADMESAVSEGLEFIDRAEIDRLSGAMPGREDSAGA